MIVTDGQSYVSAVALKVWDDMRDLSSEVKRIKGCKATITMSMDGEVHDSSIVDLFANKRKILYDSVQIQYDSSELSDMMK